MTRQAYVHHPSKTLVFWTYKAACTSLVHALAYDLFEMPMDDVDPRTKLDPMLVAYPEAVDLTLKGYRSIGLIRDPWERLVSAYLHIFVNRDGVPIRSGDDFEVSGRLGHEAISGGAQEFRGLTFRTFIEHCLTRIEQRDPEPNLDPHWDTQIPFFFLEHQFRYDHLFPLARTPEFYAALSGLVGKPVLERRENMHRREAPRAMNLVDANSLEYCDDGSLRHIQNFEDANLRGAVERAYEPDYHYYSPLIKRVVIVGGAGVFGRRLAEGLHASTYIILAGRSLERAQQAAVDLGPTEAIALDRDTATPEDIRAVNADLVIDAAGPFQGADLRFARAVIEAGAGYIDLADARDFVAAFPSLDALARQHNVAAVTGASSTPALTHAVLDQLRAGWRRLDTVRAGIAPANQMDRGAAVMKAILTWVGAPVRVFEDGAWRKRSGWSDCGFFDVPNLGRRRFALTEVPDLDLIPARYAPRDTALFMAGLELPLMQRGMEFVAALRRWRIIPNPVRFAEPLRHAGNLLLPFGSDRSSMTVEASGRDAEDRPVFARWSMFAPNGQGPYTPTFPALLMAKRFIAGDPAPPGARPCVGMLTLDEFEPVFARHGFSTQIDVTPLQSPFETALGAAFDNAPPAVRAAHCAGPVTRLRGEARVQGAASPLAWLAARLFGMPRSAERIPVHVTMRLDPEKETWSRRFGDRRMESRLRAVAPGIVRESFGPFGFDMKLSVADGVLSMTIVGWRIGSIPLPAFLAPRSTATESVDEQGRFRFDVPIALPLIGRLTHYSGWLVPEEVEAAPAPSEREAA